MNYRLATPDDAPLLAQMNHQLIQDEGHRNSMTPPELEHRMRQWLSTHQYQAVLFEPLALPVIPSGYALFRHETDHIYLRHLFVQRHLRRQGIARNAIAWLRENHVKDARLRIDVLIHNHAAIAFYRALGFHDHSLTMEFDASIPSATNFPGAH